MSPFKSERREAQRRRAQRGMLVKGRPNIQPRLARILSKLDRHEKMGTHPPKEAK